VTVLNPAEGSVLRQEGDLQIVAQAQNGMEPVEVSRYYRYDVAAQRFDSGILQQHGTHLPGDIHIPVRLLEVEVVNTLPVRSAADLEPTNIVTSRRPGEDAYVLAPTSILLPLSLGPVIYPGGSPAGITHPTPSISAQDVPAELRAYIWDGGIFHIQFPSSDPPEEPADLEFRLDVGRPGNTATLQANLRLEPHFRLTLPGGTPVYRLARGAELTLDVTDGIHITNVATTPTAGITTELAANGTQLVLRAAADAPLGPCRVRVEDSANTEHKARRTIEII